VVNTPRDVERAENDMEKKTRASGFRENEWKSAQWGRLQKEQPEEGTIIRDRHKNVVGKKIGKEDKEHYKKTTEGGGEGERKLTPGHRGGVKLFKGRNHFLPGREGGNNLDKKKKINEDLSAMLETSTTGSFLLWTKITEICLSQGGKEFGTDRPTKREKGPCLPTGPGRGAQRGQAPFSLRKKKKDRKGGSVESSTREANIAQEKQLSEPLKDERRRRLATVLQPRKLLPVRGKENNRQFIAFAKPAGGEQGWRIAQGDSPNKETKATIPH